MKKFDKNKYLKKLKFKKRLTNNLKYFYLIIPCIMCFLLGIFLTYSKFFSKQETQVIRTTVGDFSKGDIVISAYIDGEYINNIPNRNDGYEVEKIVCDHEAVGKWDNDEWGLLTTNLTQKTKCNVYFKKVDSKVPNIITSVDTTGRCPTINDDGSVSVTGIEATDGYLCKAKDAYGDSYYFRGNVTNNYVKFAGFYWRIVRVNGDSSVRVIYDGTSAHANGESSSDRQIGTSAFNSGKKDNVYVGYMYGTTGASSYAETHANANDSVIKIYIDNWYKTNFLNTDSEKYLVDNLFCDDRSIANSSTGTGAGTSETYYRWYWGPWDSGNHNDYIKLLCPQQNDAFTVEDVINGNGALTYSIGLLSTDEIVLAGGWNTANNKYYLYTGQSWWTMTSRFYNGSYAGVRYMNSNSVANTSSNVDTSHGVRPVLNLSAETIKYGDGTINNPYRLTY